MKQKNIYVIVSDQHAAAAFGAWGNNEVKTPNLDALAEVSFNFPNSYCPAPICGPSRFALLSGRHVHRCGAYDNGSSIPYDTPTLGHLMTNAGYRSVLCGRMHIHGPEQLAGFEERPEVGWINPIHAGASGMKSRGSFIENTPEISKGTEYNHYEVNDSPIINIDDYTIATACKTAANATEVDPRPLFMVIGLYGPHPSVRARKEYLDLIKMYDKADLTVNEFSMEQLADEHAYTREFIMNGNSSLPDCEYNRRMLVEYYARITYTDMLIGRFLDSLRECGEYADAMIIYCSDHGESMGIKGSWGKVVFTDNASRIPLTVKPPGKNSRTDRKHLASLVDIFPTLAEKCGVKVDYEISGTSLIPLLNEQYAEPAGPSQGAVLSQFHGIYTSHSNFMLRKGDYKYCRYNTLTPELFNMVEDPLESQNLADEAEHAATVADMDKSLLNILGEAPEAIETRIRDNQARRNFIAESVGNSPIVTARLKERIKAFRNEQNSAWWDGGTHISQYEKQFKK
ncbi:MAG: sulfatase-like hydrolase/transferase [Victivallaceae bacterium]|nr:sulfatase-like hydrolase/transferase [Victivallaceae bacterium]